MTLSKFWVSFKNNGTKVFMLKMWSHIYVKIIFNDFEIICCENLGLFTNFKARFGTRDTCHVGSEDMR